jgi:hypothetical protein
VSAKKPPDRRHNRHTRDLGVVVAFPERASVPAPQAHWADATIEGWNDFWLSMMAGPQVLKVTDHPALRRLFDMRDRLAKAMAAFDADPVVEGSMGQQALSPWAQEVHRLEAAVDKLETHFGLTPLARMKLGVTFEHGRDLTRQNADLMAAFRASQYDPDDDAS